MFQHAENVDTLLSVQVCSSRGKQGDTNTTAKGIYWSQVNRFGQRLEVCTTNRHCTSSSRMRYATI